MSKKYAVLGDIHSNLDALEVVLADAKEMGVTDYLCVGDVVGYNAYPNECCDIIRSLNCTTVWGNHDYYASSSILLDDFHPHAAHVIAWTRNQLSPENMQWLRSLEYTKVQSGITLVHATLDGPEHWGYVFEAVDAEPSFSYQKTGICFHGHTHVPAIYEQRGGLVTRYDSVNFKVEMGRKFFVNVGSVGQPRDSIPDASYCIYDPLEHTVCYRRLPYDVKRAQARIREAGLPERLASRLEVGR